MPVFAYAGVDSEEVEEKVKFVSASVTIMLKVLPKPAPNTQYGSFPG